MVAVVASGCCLPSDSPEFKPIGLIRDSGVVVSARSPKRSNRSAGLDLRDFRFDLTIINLQTLIDEINCFETVRAMRGPDSLKWLGCDSSDVVKNGRDDTQPQRQRDRCHGCGERFDDLSGTIFAGHHQPLRAWILYLDLMGLNLSRLNLPEPVTSKTSDPRADLFSSDDASAVHGRYG